jgi:hypothetical protein
MKPPADDLRLYASHQFYDRGYNVLVMTMPYHGWADRMNTEHARLRAEDFIQY